MATTPTFYEGQALDDEAFRALQHAINVAPVMIWIAGTDKLCNWFNQRWLDFVGRPMELELGNGWADNVHLDDFQRCLETYVNSFDARQPFTMEYRLRRHDGEYRWILDNGVPVYSPDGEFRGYAGSCVDINERKLEEQKKQDRARRLALARQAGGLGVWDWDFQTNEVEWSPELEMMHGYESGTFPRTLDAYQAEIYPEDAERVFASVQNAIATGQKHHVVYRILQPNGPPRWVEGNGQVIFAKDGKTPLRLVGVCMDVHDRKQAQEELAREREAIAKRATEQAALYQFTDRLQRTDKADEVYDAALDAILTALKCDRASILLFDDEAVMRFVAWRGLTEGYRTAVEGHSPWKADATNPLPITVEEMDATSESEALKSTIRNEGITSLAFIPLMVGERLIGKFMVYYDAKHVFSEGETDLAMAIARQLSFGLERRRSEIQRQKAEESLRQLTAELEEKVRIRTADLEGFAYSIAHDMRQHIRGVGVNAFIVSKEGRDQLSDELREILDRLVLAARHLTKLTDDILTHTKIGVRDLAKAQLNLSEMVRTMWKDVTARPHCNQAASLVVEDEVIVTADPSMIGLVMENLLDNACKFSALSGHPVVRFGRDGSSLYVSDNGIGFEEKYSETVFKAFERLDPSYEGTGIGLTSVRRIVERHGGRVWAEPEPGKGTTIRFTLPG